MEGGGVKFVWTWISILFLLKTIMKTFSSQTLSDQLINYLVRERLYSFSLFSLSSEKVITKSIVHTFVVEQRTGCD